MALSDSFLRSVHGKESPAVKEKTDRDGLSVRISPKGKVVFQMRYRYDGKQKRVDIGTYPGMTLKEARDETIVLRRVLDDGTDPSEFLATRVIEKHRALSVEEVIREWHGVYAASNIKKNHEILRTFEIHVFPDVGAVKHDSLSAHSWLTLIGKIKGKSHSIAKRVLSISKQAHSWALRRGMVKTAPLESITNKDMGIKIGVTDRVLDDDEIRLLFEVMSKSRMARKNQLLVKLILLFGCRSGELISASVKHFDLDKCIWTVPPENHKTGKGGKSLVRPIIPAAKEMIEEAMRLNGGSDNLFERAKAGHYPDRPMNSSSMLSVPKTFMAWALKHKGIVMPIWSLHDLRRTARTRWSSIAPPHVCEIMLGHKLPGVWAVYDHSGYIEEQREAYLAWWEEVERIVGES